MAALELLIKIVLALGVVAYVGLPLLKTQFEDDTEVMSEEAEDLYRRKESTYSAIKELEFDYKTGKLSDQDYAELDAKYRADAIEVLETIDMMEHGATAPAKTPSGDAPKKRGKGLKPRPAAALERFVCVECEQENSQGARFCGGCGSELGGEIVVKSGNGSQAPSSECVDCGKPVKDGHKFCASCGAEVRV